MRKLVLIVMLAATLPLAPAQVTTPVDSDRDGLSDALEGSLLKQFEPRFLISSSDCSARPAEFVPLQAKPVVESENGTIYGQAFPRTGQTRSGGVAFLSPVASSTAATWVTHWMRSTYQHWCREKGTRTGRRFTGMQQHTRIRSAMRARLRAPLPSMQNRGPQVWISRGKHGPL